MFDFFVVKDVFVGYVVDVFILQGINFFIVLGELVIVIGFNGVGKFILVKIIFGLFILSQGEIIFKGENIIGFGFD